MNNFDGDTPTLSEVVEAGIQDALQVFWTAIPAKVSAFNPATGCADVAPVARQIDRAGNVVDLPAIVCMPVLFPAGGGYSISWKLQAGDPCLVIFSSLSLAQWIQSGNEQAQPESPRRNTLTDGIVIPGIRPFTAPLLSPSGGAEFSAGKDDGTSALTIDAAGVVTVEAPARINIGAGAVSPAALATLTDAVVTAIQTGFDSHTHTAPSGGGATTPPLVSLGPQGSVAASKSYVE